MDPTPTPVCPGGPQVSFGGCDNSAQERTAVVSGGGAAARPCQTTSGGETSLTTHRRRTVCISVVKTSLGVMSSVSMAIIPSVRTFEYDHLKIAIQYL